MFTGSKVSMHRYRYCLVILTGSSVPCVCSISRTDTMYQLICGFCLHNRGEAIRVARVVVVDIATRIHIPRIIRVATIRRAKTNVLRYNLHPVLFRICLMPPLNHFSGFNRQLRPIAYFFALQVEEPSCYVYEC